MKRSSARLFTLGLVLGVLGAAAFLAAGASARGTAKHPTRPNESGRPVIVSVPKRLPNSATREDFPWVASIEWPYPVRDRGMPSDPAYSAAKASAVKLGRPCQPTTVRRWCI